MAYYVYVLESIESNKRYVGYTKRSIKERLSEHNIKKTSWTSIYKLWRLIYYEKFECIKCAISREKFFKTGYGRSLLDVIITADIYKMNKQ